MDEHTLKTLRTALTASPDSIDLLVVVAEALVDRGDAAEGARIVQNAGKTVTLKAD
ncbi:MAG TPA: hypothetical protein PK156_48585 [Polyangium sp.]|nr:hypothetical protein [Polyangium sp.]